ncbi:hypothetical protein Sdia_48250 [Streptomyces diastaticus subsp. diastaticus]|uniref:DUF222 domain-containing protein n=1 Tax=Streptomyces diastaticus subsp. diastaticus TaxID=68040 RepID=A0ABQ1CUS5_STRDI|nr:hypothetical protein [Streptomyces diastaticus]GFH74057.1 hypothetical protein Sdia_48250 [Streptomyces diastaticus subsp. diastaticus]GGU49392.1 hypothetical protein GCM10015534_59090 [Streptomyces diastaticus subsp. diastaticus]
MHGHFTRLDHIGKQPVVHRAPEEQVCLLRSMARCVQDPNFAEMCLELAIQVEAAEDRLAGLGRADEAVAIRSLMIGQAMEWVVHVWRLADQIDDLRARQKAWSKGHHRVARVLKSARIPLWVVGVLEDISHDELRTMTPGDLVRRAGLGNVWIAEAAQVLDRLRALALLGVDLADWNELLDQLATCLDADKNLPASRVGNVDVPPRPCGPPGGLVLTEPRVPRAPGCAVPRRITTHGRRLLHQDGRCGGHLTA